MSCGRVRKKIKEGYTPLVKEKLDNLEFGTILLNKGDSYEFNTGQREYALVLISGFCEVDIKDTTNVKLGPRRNPFKDLPYGAMIGKGKNVIVTSIEKTYIGAGSAPAKEEKATTIITPKEVGNGDRGKDNWSRKVRFVCWSDNTEGNMLIAGETVTPSGNWSTIPPHRHDKFIDGEEVPYEETYFFQFSKPQGYGLVYQFDEDLDQAFSLKANDVAYMSHGYHPTVCGPGADLYHLTFISGPYRMSKSQVHKDYAFILDENNMENPYRNQKSR